MEYLKKYWHVLAGVLCVALLGGFYMWRGRSAPVLQNQAPERTMVALAAPEPDETAQILDEIVVHIEGAVVNPGVFTLSYGSRVNDALTLAGGATEEADLARINLAAFLEDAQQIIIPTAGEETPLQIAQEADSGLVNINTADERLLTTLPGIGPARAGNIIAHREASGPFSTIEDLQNVPGIGAGILNNVRAHITVN